MLSIHVLDNVWSVQRNSYYQLLCNKLIEDIPCVVHVIYIYIFHV